MTLPNIDVTSSFQSLGGFGPLREREKASLRSLETQSHILAKLLLQNIPPDPLWARISGGKGVASGEKVKAGLVPEIQRLQPQLSFELVDRIAGKVVGEVLGNSGSSLLTAHLFAAFFTPASFEERLGDFVAEERLVAELEGAGGGLPPADTVPTKRLLTSLLAQVEREEVREYFRELTASPTRRIQVSPSPPHRSDLEDLSPVLSLFLSRSSRAASRSWSRRRRRCGGGRWRCLRSWEVGRRWVS
jgi:hypothetical protein